MEDGAMYTPAGPDAEAAIEVEIPVPDGTVYFRIPFSVFCQVSRTVSDGREDMFRAFSNLKSGIWPKLSKRVSTMIAGEIYTLTAEDLRWDVDPAPGRSQPG